jgi:hypothetical protein
MDGTGELFDECLSFYNGEYEILTLPNDGPQDHHSLSKYIQQYLPKENYILLAESFSGAIVPDILKTSTQFLKGVIFIASFLSTPNYLLCKFSGYLPLKQLVKLPLANIMIKQFLLGSDASDSLIFRFKSILQSIPENLLKERLKVMTSQVLPKERYAIPGVYIQANSDRLVAKYKSIEVGNVFTSIEYIEVAGPHFLIQAHPKQMANILNEVVHTIERQKKKLI